MSEETTNSIEYAKETVGRDPMANFLGITVEEVRQGFARCSLVIKPDYLNALDRAHGAAVYAVADQAFAVAANSMENRAVALNLTINYAAGASEGERLVSEAAPLHIGRKVSIWRIEVRGNDRRLIASCEAIAYHK
jgi:acyl-CoA thioesterase